MKAKLTFIGILIYSLIFSSCKQRGPDLMAPEIPEFANPEKFIGEHQAQIMILGTFHFANPGLDSYKPQYEVDIFSEKRQAELNEIIDKLLKFKPTKVMLEVSRVANDSLLNDRYSKYLKGVYDLSTRHSETYQLGFRLAEEAGHRYLYAIDEKLDWYGANLDWENFRFEAYQESLGQKEKANRYNYQKFFEWQDSLKMKHSLKDHYILINNPKVLRKGHQIYLTNTGLTGAGDNYIGADAVGRWYGRNMRIYSNIYDLTDFDQKERIVLIYGAGHVWTLRQILMDSPDYEYVELSNFLNQ